MANQLAAVDGASTEVQTDLRQLGSLTGTRLSTNNHNLVALQGILDDLPLTRDGQFFRKADL